MICNIIYYSHLTDTYMYISIYTARRRILTKRGRQPCIMPFYATKIVNIHRLHLNIEELHDNDDYVTGKPKRSWRMDSGRRGSTSSTGSNAAQSRAQKRGLTMVAEKLPVGPTDNCDIVRRLSRERFYNRQYKTDRAVEVSYDNDEDENEVGRGSSGDLLLPLLTILSM